MTSGEFNKAIQQLENFYGKEYNDIQKQEIFKTFAQYTAARFVYLISLVYKQYKYLPMLSELVELHSTIPYAEIKKKLGKKIKCEKCKNRGFYIYTKNHNGIDYDFIVKCDCSEDFDYDGRKMKNPRNKTKYYIPSQAEAYRLGMKRKEL